VRFLNKIIKGKQYTSERKITENSYECTLAYGEAIRAVDMVPIPEGTPPKSVVTFVKECLRVAEAISENRVVDEKSVSDLRMFFDFVREVSLRVDRKPIEMVSVSE
jgi:hypothetical protein